MSLIEFKKNKLVHNNVGYFTAGSDMIGLGTYGKMLKSPFAPNRLEPWAEFPQKKMVVQEATAIDIDTKSSKKGDVDAALDGINVLGMNIRIGAKAGFKMAEDKDIRLVKLWVQPRDMEEAINDSNKHRADLAEEGSDARVANVVFVVAEWEESKKLTNSAGFDVSGSNGTLELTINGRVGAGAGETIRITEGSCAGYGILKPVWDHSRKSKRDKVVDLKVDDPGLT